MIQQFNNICAFRQTNPGTSGNGLSVTNPALVNVKNDLRLMRTFLEKEFSNYRGFNFTIEESRGQTYFPSVLHVCILPPNQTVSSGIYTAICFDINGNGALVGCAESVTNPKGLNTVNRKRRNVELAIDVDGLRPTTKYNNSFENPKEYRFGLTSNDDILNHLRLSLDLALYHLGLSNPSSLTIKDRVNANINNEGFDPFDLNDAREIISRNIAARRGQNKFRKTLLEAYNYRCSITGSNVESVLEAAHIMPYRGKQTNHIQNGLLLRSDIHLLFDLGLITVFADTYKIVVHSSLQETDYFSLNDKVLFLPNDHNNHPNRDALRFHYENEFQE